MNIRINKISFYRENNNTMLELPSLASTVVFCDIEKGITHLDKYWLDKKKLNYTDLDYLGTKESPYVHEVKVIMNLDSTNVQGLYFEAYVDNEYYEALDSHYGSHYQEALNRTFWAIVKYQINTQTQTAYESVHVK